MECSTFRLTFIFLAIICKAHITKSQNPSCNSNDLNALNGFRKCVGSPVDGWGVFPDGECCSWAGVTCNNSAVTQRRVIGLDLHGRGLTGEICESLADLDQLSTLNLSHNNLHGFLPHKLFQMQNLEVLDLSWNKFMGSFPLHIHLPRIRILDVSDNNLVGSLTSTICDRSHSIESLNFAENWFHGEVPVNFGNCTSLQRLFLNGNSLSGSLPERLFQLEHLCELQFQDNGFSGPLDGRIDNLSSVVKIDLSHNLFSGVLPDVFKGLPKLEHFAARSNKFSGQLPPSLMSSPSLSTLDLNNNTLDGRISINCSSMARLTSLNLGSNLFRGPLPAILSTCHRLSVLNLANNHLSGAIPSSFQNLRALTLLSLSKTEISDLSSALHILQRCRNLSVLILSMSFREEEMLGHADLLFPYLKVFVIGNSQLKGSIPVWLSGCENLQLLDLSWNQLSGRIPSWIGDFDFLFYLGLGNNSFTGDIPRSLSELRNCINSSRSFPAGSLSNVPLLSGKGDGKFLTYNQFWSLPSTLDLSYNKLNGPIWLSFGNLKGLQAFYLENNQLSGNIPNSLSEMQSLERLDLSHNGLTGEIPASFQKLTFLSTFDVSYNKLSGTVPSGGQFLTFPDSSFEGNIGLCGSRPSLPSCQSQPPSDELPNDEASTEGATYSQMAFGIGAAVGFTWTVSLCFLSGWVIDEGQRSR
ncbi:phytosulfokine receptor 1-like [Syzygium oleosum]|uniref:phytosulfokine receptor 1-like n=1 Tax=Syzygium oleosum TaxID=219896 RepID=UPI0024B9A2B7|nr:phytosulfokine receptor 1-like [Syzygium oleosum]